MAKEEKQCAHANAQQSLIVEPARVEVAKRMLDQHHGSISQPLASCMC